MQEAFRMDECERCFFVRGVHYVIAKDFPQLPAKKNINKNQPREEMSEMRGLGVGLLLLINANCIVILAASLF